MHTDIIYILCSSALIAMGVYAFLANTKSNINRSFLLMTISAALWIIFLYMMYTTEYSATLPSTFVRLANGMTLLALLFISYFFYYFPKKTFEIKGEIKYILPIAALILFMISSFTPYSQSGIQIENGVVKSETYGTLFPLHITIMISWTGTIGYYVYKKLKKLHGIEKTKLKIVSFSFLLVASLTVVSNIILPFFGITFLMKYSAIVTLLFIAPTLYALQKHSFFNTSYIVMNAFRWFILGGSLIVITFVYSQLFSLVFSKIDSLYLTITVSFLTIISFLKIQKYFPKFIPKDLQELKNAIKELNLNLYYSESFKEFIKHLENVFISKLHIKNLQFDIIRSKKDHFEMPIYIEDEFTSIIENLKKSIFSFQQIEYFDIPKQKKEILKKKLKQLESELCIPLFAEHKLIGLLCIGKKNNNKPFAKEEIQEFVKTRNILEITLMNLLLKHNLQEENNLMKEIIEKKTKKLRNQFDKIKSLLEQQSDFIAVTAHEFRTPLSIALFQLEDTLDSHEHKPEVLRDMEVMSESLKNLKDLTQTMFDVQQYDLNKVVLNKDKIDILEFLNNITKDIKSLMGKHKFHFNFECEAKDPIYISIDSSQIRQVIINLINNAVKFASKDNPIIELGLKSHDKKIQIYVSDNGEGVPNKDKNRIFNKFQTTNVSEGTGIGLGLYICQKIIELHKGKLWVKDNENSGAKFIFELNK